MQAPLRWLLLGLLHERSGPRLCLRSPGAFGSSRRWVGDSGDRAALAVRMGLGAEAGTGTGSISIEYLTHARCIGGVGASATLLVMLDSPGELVVVMGAIVTCLLQY